jgi:hypothetical protein
MFRKVLYAMLGLALTVGAGCGSAASTATGSPTPAGTAAPTGSLKLALPAASAAPVSYDPCVLLPASEASALTGVNYGPGRSDVVNGLKRCTYGYQTTDVFQIGIAQAPDQATAQADSAQAQAEIQRAATNGVNVTQLQGVGDAAAEIQGSATLNGATFSAVGIYVLKGTVYFGISDIEVNHTAPSGAALQAEAMAVLGRL